MDSHDAFAARLSAMRPGFTFEVLPSGRLRLERVVADRNAAQKHVWRPSFVPLSADGFGRAALLRRPDMW